MVQNLRKFFASVKDWTIFCLLVFFGVTLSVSSSLSKTFLEGLGIWANSVLPTLFPYLVLTALLNSTNAVSKISAFSSPLFNRAFKVNGGASYVFLMSVLSGCPMGAKLTCDLYENKLLSKTEAVRTFCLCQTSSPVFTISCVGNMMFKNSLFGLCLFLTNIIACIIVGIIFSFYKRKDPPTKSVSLNTQSSSNLLYESIYSSITTILVVGGFIAIFYLLVKILILLNILTPLINLLTKLVKDKTLSEGIVLGLFESTGGIKIISQTGFCTFTLPLVCFLCGFGGISVIMQSVAFIKKCNIKTARFILAKITCAVVSFIIGLIFSLVFF